MNLIPDVPVLYKVGAAALLVAMAGLWHVHAVESAASAATTAEDARHQVIDAANTARAKAKLAASNDEVRKAQVALAAARADLAKLQTENDHEKLVSSQRQSDLLAGRERLRILTTAARHPDQAGPPAGAGAATLDQGTGAYADIDPGVAAGLDGIRERHNEAVRRLTACVAAYDAVKAAADSLGL